MLLSCITLIKYIVKMRNANEHLKNTFKDLK